MDSPRLLGAGRLDAIVGNWAQKLLRKIPNAVGQFSGDGCLNGTMQCSVLKQDLCSAEREDINGSLSFRPDMSLGNATLFLPWPLWYDASEHEWNCTRGPSPTFSSI
jgi:hypothetical protein